MNFANGVRFRAEILQGVSEVVAIQKPMLDESTTGLDRTARRERAALVSNQILCGAERCDRLTLPHEARVITGGTLAELKGQVGGNVVEFGTTDPARAADVLPGGIGTMAIQQATLTGAGR